VAGGLLQLVVKYREASLSPPSHEAGVGNNFWSDPVIFLWKKWHPGFSEKAVEAAGGAWGVGQVECKARGLWGPFCDKGQWWGKWGQGS